MITSPTAAAPDAAQAQRAGDVAARLREVRARLAEATTEGPAGVTLVAVSKYADLAQMRAARAAGVVDFGESRAQDLKAKAPELPGARWHFVGRLQRNKVSDVVGRVTLIHSVDRAELAESIAARASALGIVQRVLVQVNIGDDPAKGGCAPDLTVTLVARVRALPGVACVGLMTIPPRDGDARAVFAELRSLRDALRSRYAEVEQLSMGMSADFEAALAEGATIVRVGQALFQQAPGSGSGGARQQPSE